MTLYAPSQGLRTKVGKTLSTTDPTTLISVPADNTTRRATIDSIHVSCGGTATALSIWWVDKNGNENFLLSGGTIAANDIFQIKDIHLPLEAGESLQCEAAAADFIGITVVYINSTPQQAAK